MRFVPVTSLIIASLGCLSIAMATSGRRSEPSTIYDFKMTNIDGRAVKLSRFKGKVILVVNVASKCGYTPQYKGLEALYKEKKDKGFVILGFPANNFGAQEPGSDAEIKQFCTGKYDVTFPMFSKISVKGDDEHPLYKWLIENSDRHDDIEWNFTKFVIGKDGKVFKRFMSKDTPDSEQVTQAIDEALAK
ncbi:MAG: glutathione peroxidase [Fimbriimonas sp.]|nr:glutathione peroxidase [Fimbriimonas sp.]